MPNSIRRIRPDAVLRLHAPESKRRTRYKLRRLQLLAGGKLNQFNGNFIDAEMVKAFIGFR